eukprot:CAMPEP_0185787766 /NCGR_PEP_ID=MMETSP1174-20130828/142717_1 /TAXON_ID=35687 /ORGANISM="Dictyocha speculum, Strain CCMP1381" /LENGTH=47 /DNA_ID= /DNA_START= /DNA_END= /DNA_ORIENTATION=
MARTWSGLILLGSHRSGLKAVFSLLSTKAVDLSLKNEILEMTMEIMA